MNIFYIPLYYLRICTIKKEIFGLPKIYFVIFPYFLYIGERILHGLDRVIGLLYNFLTASSHKGHSSHALDWSKCFYFNIAEPFWKFCNFSRGIWVNGDLMRRKKTFDGDKSFWMLQKMPHLSPELHSQSSFWALSRSGCWETKQVVENGKTDENGRKKVTFRG